MAHLGDLYGTGGVLARAAIMKDHGLGLKHQTSVSHTSGDGGLISGSPHSRILMRAPCLASDGHLSLPHTASPQTLCTHILSLPLLRRHLPYQIRIHPTTSLNPITSSNPVSNCNHTGELGRGHKSARSGGYLVFRANHNCGLLNHTAVACF